MVVACEVGVWCEDVVGMIIKCVCECVGVDVMCVIYVVVVPGVVCDADVVRADITLSGVVVGIVDRAM